MSAKAYRLLKFYKNFLTQGQSLVEIGSERGGGSTKYFHEICSEEGYKFYTVDIDPDIYKRAGEIAPGSAVLQDGTQFLESLEGEICFVYLDNFDWDWGGMGETLTRQIHRYKELDLELNNENSQHAHFTQSRLVESKASDPCFVLLDDTFWSEKLGQWSGKGGTAIPFLLSKEFQILDSGSRYYRDKPFVLLGRGTVLGSVRWRLNYMFHKLVSSRIYMDDLDGLSLWLRRWTPNFVHTSFKKFYRTFINPPGTH